VWPSALGRDCLGEHLLLVAAGCGLHRLQPVQTVSNLGLPSFLTAAVVRRAELDRLGLIK
jgi:hypothetical protein